MKSILYFAHKIMKDITTPFLEYLIKLKGYPKIEWNIILPIVLLLPSLFLTNILENINYIIAINNIFISLVGTSSLLILFILPLINNTRINKPLYCIKYLSTKAIPVELYTTKHGSFYKINYNRKMFIACISSYICFLSIVIIVYGLLILNTNFMICKIIYIWLWFSIIVNILVLLLYASRLTREHE